METCRLFIAISLPDEIKDPIEKAQSDLRAALPREAVRWTKRGQFHLTLKFLGNVSIGRIEALTGALREACSGSPALRLRAERIGFFPDMRFPRVIWAGVHDEKELLPKLQQAIEAAVKGFTIEESEEKFIGHVTLGRAKTIKRPQAEILAKMALGMADRFFGEWIADKVELIRSEPGSDGPRYTTLVEIPLAKELSSERPPK